LRCGVIAAGGRSGSGAALSASSNPMAFENRARKPSLALALALAPISALAACSPSENRAAIDAPSPAEQRELEDAAAMLEAVPVEAHGDVPGAQGPAPAQNRTRQ